MHKEIFICKNTQKQVLACFTTLDLAMEAWRLSCSKLFIPIFEQCSPDFKVLSATKEILGYITYTYLYTEVTHL